MSLEVIIGLCMGLTNVVKKIIPEKFKELLPIFCLCCIVLVSIIEAKVNNKNILIEGQNALVVGAITLGIFTAGTYTARGIKVVMDKEEN
jgi:Na+/glutamate symporter